MDCRDRPDNDVLRFGAILLSKRHHPRARALYASEHSSALAKKHEGAGAPLRRIEPFRCLSCERRALRSAPARRLCVAGRTSGDESPALAGRLAPPGTPGEPALGAD